MVILNTHTRKNLLSRRHLIIVRSDMGLYTISATEERQETTIIIKFATEGRTHKEILYLSDNPELAELYNEHGFYPDEVVMMLEQLPYPAKITAVRQ